MSIDIRSVEMVLAMLRGDVELQGLAHVHGATGLVIDETEVLLDPGRRHYLPMDIAGPGDILDLRDLVTVSDQFEDHRGIGNRRLSRGIGLCRTVLEQGHANAVARQARGEHVHARRGAEQRDIEMPRSRHAGHTNHGDLTVA